MRKGQDLTEITAAVLQSVSHVIARESPDVIVVQGDTTTTFAAALSAFFSRSRWLTWRPDCGPGTAPSHFPKRSTAA